MDASSETRLRELRLNLAEICLEGRIERIAALCRNPSGDALMTMINSGVRHLAMSKGDQAVAERCHRILSVEHDVGRKVSAYLALNLFTFPHTIDRSFDIVDVPTPLIATVVKAQLAVPMFFTRDGARRRALAHVEATVQEIHKAATVIDELDFRREILTGFMDGYSAVSIYAEDVPLKALAQRRAGLIRLYLETFGLTRDITPAPHQHGIIRLGVLCPGAFSETAALRGHLKGLNRNEFQVTAFVPDEAATSVGAGFEDVADDFLALPVGDIPQAAEIVAAQELDILVCGANITNICRFPWTLLMAQRLAPLQAVMHASNLTTGFQTVDVYLNGVLNEPADGQSDYTEELVLFAGSSNHYIMAGAQVAAGAGHARADRDSGRRGAGGVRREFLQDRTRSGGRLGPHAGSRPGRTSVDVSVQSELDDALPAQGRLPSLRAGAFRGAQRRHRTLARAGTTTEPRANPRRAQRWPISTSTAFPIRARCRCSIRLSVGCPPVVREGHTARCRQSAALLRDLGLDVLVTRSAEHYVTLAIRLLQDHTLRREMREAIGDVARQTGLGQNDGIGERVGQALKDALRRKIGNAARQGDRTSCHAAHAALGSSPTHID